MRFIHLNVFKPNEHTEDYQIRKPNDEKVPFENDDKKYIYIGEKVITFETKELVVE